MLSHRVFVYGTLKRGHRNHHFLEKDGVEFLGEATTREKNFIMRCFGSVSSPGKYTPGVLKGGNASIEGEVYSVSDAVLADLDRLENVGEKYDRELIALDDGTSAYIYLEREGLRTAIPGCASLQHDPAGNLYRWNP